MAHGIIPDEHKWRYFFHMTDIDNLESILKYGLLCTNKKNSLGIEHVNIANSAIQERRSEMRVPCSPQGVVHDYVPFYFTSRSPMLLGQLNAKNCDQPLIIYLCLKIEKLLCPNVIFTDASANTIQQPNFYDDVGAMPNLSWDLIDAYRWKYEEMEIHKKMAEVLIYQSVPVEEIDAIIVYNADAKAYVKEILRKHNYDKIRVCFDYELNNRYHCYYTKFQSYDPCHRLDTLVHGPRFIQWAYENMQNNVKEGKKKKSIKTYQYHNINELLNAIHFDFCVLKELAGIWNLETSNEVHHCTVSDHTMDVVRQIKQLSYFRNTDKHRQELLELSAYLHDIGKGPHEKWENGIQQPYPDHPYDAIGMLERIFIEEVEFVSEEDVRIIGLLVAYHDIIGDSISGNRNIEALKSVLKSKDDFDMLACLSEADIKSVDLGWWVNFNMRLNDIRVKLFPHE